MNFYKIIFYNMSNNEEILLKLKEVIPQKGERTKTLSGKISSLLMQLSY